MNCHEFDQRLQQLLDDRLSPTRDPQLQAHAMRCAACEELLAGYATMLAGVRQATAARAKVGSRFAAQVVTRMATEQPVAPACTATPARWRVWGVLTTVAALVVLAVGVGTWSSLRSSHADNGGLVADAEASRPRAGVVGVAALGPVEPAVQRVAPPPGEVVSPVWPLPLLGGADATAQDGFDSYRITIQTLAMQLPDAVIRIDAVEQYAPGIRPIRESFTTAFETLWKTIPGKQVDQPGQRPQASWGGTTEALVA